jgi:crotonobetainyl-CoA:carnitine CoA-transferase CaiB-like acyl-CoA transferase
MHVTGEPDGPPTSVGLPVCDLGTGMWAVQGILAALYERQRTGKGRLGLSEAEVKDLCGKRVL